MSVKQTMTIGKKSDKEMPHPKTPRPSRPAHESDSEFISRIWLLAAGLLPVGADGYAFQEEWVDILNADEKYFTSPHPAAAYRIDYVAWNKAEAFARVAHLSDVASVVKILQMPRLVTKTQRQLEKEWAQDVHPHKEVGDSAVTFLRSKFVSGKIYALCPATAKYILATNELSQDGQSLRHIHAPYEETN